MCDINNILTKCKPKCKDAKNACPVYIVSHNNSSCNNNNITKIYYLFNDTPKLIYYDGLSNNSSIAIDMFGNLYYFDLNRQAIVKLDRFKHATYLNLYKYTTKIAITLDNCNNLYIADTINKTIIINKTNINILHLPKAPNALVYDSCNKILYVSTTCHCSKLFIIYNDDITTLEVINPINDKLVISSLAITSNQELLIADKATNTIYKLINKEYKIFAQNGYLNKPIHMTTDMFDNLYVVNEGDNNVIKIDNMSFQSVFNNNIIGPGYIASKRSRCCKNDKK
jgi:hypothetical protein